MRRHDHAHRLRVRPTGDRDRRDPRAAPGPLGRAVPRRLQLPRHALRGAAAHGLRRDAGGDRRRVSELQGVHDGHPAAAPEASLVPARLRADPAGHGRGRAARRPGDDPRRGRRARPDRLRALSRRGAARRDEHASRPHQAVRAAGVRPGHRAGPRHRHRDLLRPHLGPRRGRGRGGRPRGGPARLRGDAPPVRLLRRRALQDPARLLRPHLSVAQAAGGPRGAVARAGGRPGLDPGDGRVPDQPRAEAPRADHRGRDGREPRRGSAPRHRVHRGCRQARHVARAVRRDHRDQRRADLRPLSAKGRDRAGQRRRPRAHRPGHSQDADAGRLPRQRLQPLGGLGRVRLAGHDAPARPGDRRPRPGARRARRRAAGPPADRSRRPRRPVC